MVAQADAGRAIELEVFAVFRVVAEQALGLLPRLQMLLLLQQRHGVVEPGGVIVRRARQHRFQQRLGLAIPAPLHADPRQQAQGADVTAILAQVVLDDLPRRLQVAVGVEAVGHHHLDRQLPQGGEALRGRRRLDGVSQPAEEPFQHVPARRQRRVEAHRFAQRVDGRPGVAKQDVAMAALLVEAAEPGVQRLQPLEHAQGLRDALARAQLPGLLQQGVSVAGTGAGSGGGAHRAAPASRNGSSQLGSGWSAS